MRFVLWLRRLFDSFKEWLTVMAANAISTVDWETAHLCAWYLILKFINMVPKLWKNCKCVVVLHGWWSHKLLNCWASESDIQHVSSVSILHLFFWLSLTLNFTIKWHRHDTPATGLFSLINGSVLRAISKMSTQEHTVMPTASHNWAVLTYWYALMWTSIKRFDF